MTRLEFIEQHEQVLISCAMNGISVGDWRKAEIYRYVRKLQADGNKLDYCVRKAVIKYAVSEASIWRILKSMDQPLTINV